MNRMKTLGLILLFLSLLLTLLISIKFQNVISRNFPIENPVEVPYGAHNFYNLTLEPIGKEEYHVKVKISPIEQPIQVDFWAGNSTGIGILLNATNVYGMVFEEDYPDKGIFNMIMTYAKEINITGTRRFELTGFNRNGTYCLALLNFFETTQYVSVTIEEQYLDPVPRSILEPNLINILITSGIAIIGVSILVKGSRKSVRRAKLVKA